MQIERLANSGSAAAHPGGRGAQRHDPADILMQRLAQLSDTAAMVPVLQDALEELAPRTFTVGTYTIDHCKVTPWRDISVALSLTLHSTRTGQQVRQIVAATIFATEAAARRQCETERRAAEASAVTVAPAMDMIVRLFPCDPALPGLAPATHEASIGAVLAANLPECRDAGWRVRHIDYEPLQYKPGRLCTLHYAVTLERAGRDSTRLDLFGKVYRDDRWQRSYALLDAVWQAAAAGDGRWTAAQPVAAVDRWRLILQRAVAGRQFRHELGDLTADGARPDDSQRAEEHLTGIARAVRALQQAPIASLPCLDFPTLMAAQHDNLAYLREVHQPLAHELQQLRAAIKRLAASAPPSPAVFAHGDFAHGNVLVDDAGRVGIIDVDRAGQAEPAYDIAYFLTHLASFGLRHPERAARVRRLCDHFREVFCSLAPAVSFKRLAIYEALDLSAYVLRNFRKRSHQPEWIGWATGQIAAAWDRLELAAGSKAS